jgi:serine/threonine protein kinase
MIMDYCGGGDLHDYYHSPRFSAAEFVRVTSEILSGVVYLHRRKLAHRFLSLL